MIRKLLALEFSILLLLAPVFGFQGFGGKAGIGGKAGFGGAATSCSGTAFGNFCELQHGVATSGGGTSSETLTLGSNILAGQKIIMAFISCGTDSLCGGGQPASVTPSDGPGDSFTPSSNGCQAISTGFTLCIWFVQSSLGGSKTITAACKDGSSNPSTCYYATVYAVVGTDSNSLSFDNSGNMVAASNTGTSFPCTGSTTSNANDLFYGWIFSVNSPVVGSGFTGFDVNSPANTGHEGKAVSSTQTLSAPWTGATSTPILGCAAIEI